VRTLVLGGDEDISFPGRAMVDRVSALLPGAKTELLERCRHCPPTTPEFRSWLAQRVTSFLERAEPLPAAVRAARPDA
jgi:2-hydroxy-6-oxonona-2,4-dienedioate hydrolase